MPGFRPIPQYIREMKRYGILPTTFDALKGEFSPKMIANKRGKSVAEILSARRAVADISPE